VRTGKNWHFLDGDESTAWGVEEIHGDAVETGNNSWGGVGMGITYRELLYFQQQRHTVSNNHELMML